MKIFLFIWLISRLSFLHAQEILPEDTRIEFEKGFSLDADIFIGMDDFQNVYYIKNNTLHKKSSANLFVYTNIRFGNITSVDITNPLKILVFYGDFNTILFLDNRLNELTDPLNFTVTSVSAHIAFASISSDDSLWLYSMDDNVLRRWNHQTKKIQFVSQPISFYDDTIIPIKQLSNYKTYWLIGKKKVLLFNEYGTYLGTKKADHAEDLYPHENGLIYIKDHKLYYQNSAEEIQQLQVDPAVSIKSFYVNTNHIFIFDGTKVYVFKIVKN